MDISTSTFLEGCYYELGDCIADYEEQSVYEAKLNEMFTIDLSECVTRKALQESFRDVVTKIKNAIKSLIEKFVNFVKRLRSKIMLNSISALSKAGKSIYNDLKKNKKALAESLDDSQVVADFKEIGTLYMLDDKGKFAKDEDGEFETTGVAIPEAKKELVDAIKSNSATSSKKGYKVVKNGTDVSNVMESYYMKNSAFQGDATNKQLFGEAISTAEDTVKELQKQLREADNVGKDITDLKKKLKAANTKYSLLMAYVSIVITSMKRLNKAGRALIKKAGSADEK